jgi:hypothetical protein
MNVPLLVQTAAFVVVTVLMLLYRFGFVNPIFDGLTAPVVVRTGRGKARR